MPFKEILIRGLQLIDGVKNNYITNITLNLRCSCVWMDNRKTYIRGLDLCFLVLELGAKTFTLRHASFKISFIKMAKYDIQRTFISFVFDIFDFLTIKTIDVL